MSFQLGQFQYIFPNCGNLDYIMFGNGWTCLRSPLLLLCVFGGVQWWSVWQKSIVVVYILLKLITIMLYTIELNWFSNDLTWAKQWHYCLLLYSLLLYWIIISRICITDWYFPVHSCVSITLPNCPKLNSWFRVKTCERPLNAVTQQLKISEDMFVVRVL